MAHSPTLLAALALHGGCAMTIPETADVAEQGAPREFGAVAWQRRLEPALADARASSRPVLLLFQEVPG